MWFVILQFGMFHIKLLTGNFSIAYGRNLGGSTLLDWLTVFGLSGMTSLLFSLSAVSGVTSPSRHVMLGVASLPLSSCHVSFPPFPEEIETAKDLESEPRFPLVASFYVIIWCSLHSTKCYIFCY